MLKLTNQLSSGFVINHNDKQIRITSGVNIVPDGIESNYLVRTLIKEGNFILEPYGAPKEEPAIAEPVSVQDEKPTRARKK